MSFRIDEFVLQRISSAFATPEPEEPYISEYNASFLVYLWLIVVV